MCNVRAMCTMRGCFSPFSNGNLSLYDELYEDRASLNKYKAVRKTVSGDSVKNIILNIRTPYWQCIMKPWSPLAPELIPGFCSMKRIGVFLLPLHGRDASPSQVIPHVIPPTICRYPFILLGRERHWKCLAQEHNTVSRARAQTRTMSH